MGKILFSTTVVCSRVDPVGNVVALVLPRFDEWGTRKFLPVWGRLDAEWDKTGIHDHMKVKVIIEEA